MVSWHLNTTCVEVRWWRTPIHHSLINMTGCPGFCLIDPFFPKTPRLLSSCFWEGLKMTFIQENLKLNLHLPATHNHPQVYTRWVKFQCCYCLFYPVIADIKLGNPYVYSFSCLPAGRGITPILCLWNSASVSLRFPTSDSESLNFASG